MTLIDLQIADEVAAEINSAKNTLSFSDFDAVRSYPDWDEEFGDLGDQAGDIAVDVVYRAQGTLELNCAGALDRDVVVHVAVRKRFGSHDRELVGGRLKNAAVDGLATLLDDIYKLFAGRRNDPAPLPNLPLVTWDNERATTRWMHHGKLRQGLFEGFVALHFTMAEEV